MYEYKFEQKDGLHQLEQNMNDRKQSLKHKPKKIKIIAKWFET